MSILFLTNMKAEIKISSCTKIYCYFILMCDSCRILDYAVDKK